MILTLFLPIIRALAGNTCSSNFVVCFGTSHQRIGVYFPSFFVFTTLVLQIGKHSMLLFINQVWWLSVAVFFARYFH